MLSLLRAHAAMTLWQREHLQLFLHGLDQEHAATVCQDRLRIGFYVQI